MYRDVRSRARVGDGYKVEFGVEVGVHLGSVLSLILSIFDFDLILNVPSTIFQLYRDGSSWVEPVLS